MTSSLIICPEFKPIFRVFTGSDKSTVNFLNKSNAADLRVYDLLNEKFSLFNGVFGASDEVLGAIESGIDFEKRIVEYHYFHSFTSDCLFEQIYKVLESNQIHSSDAGILCSKVEILRELSEAYLIPVIYPPESPARMMYSPLTT